MAVDRDDLTLVRKIKLQCDPDTFVEAEWGESGVQTKQLQQIVKP